MKKIFCILFAASLLVLPVAAAYASFASPFVARLSAASAVAGSAGSITIPAKITGVTSGGLNVASWISLLIPGSNVAKIAVGVAAVGGALAADYLMLKGAAWWASKNITHNIDGNYYQAVSQLVPNGYTVDDYEGPKSGGGTKEGIYADQNTAYAAANAFRSSHGLGSIAGFTAYASGLGAPGYVVYDVTVNPNIQHYYYYPPATGTHSETVDQFTSQAALEAMLALDLANNVSTAGALGLASVEVAAAALDNPNHPVNSNSTSKAAIAAALSNSISAGQKTNLEAAAVPNVGDNVLPDDAPNVNDMTPAQIAAAVQAALAGQGLSASEIAAAIAAAQAAVAQGLTQAQAQAAVAAALAGAGLSDSAIGAATAAALAGAGLATNAGVQTAVKNALDDETGVTPPTDPTPLIPDKLSLTAVLTAFVASIQSLPMFQTLNGLTINCSGSSSLCLAVLGASYCYDAGGMQGALNMIGSALLGLTTIFSFLGVFKS